MEEIFCGNCKFIIVAEDCVGGVYHNCKYKRTVKKDAIHKWIVHPSCLDKNRNNNCPNYIRKWWKFWV